MAVTGAKLTALPTKPRWMSGLSGRDADRLQPTANARVFDLRNSHASGQTIAGKGELVFEGETLEPGAFRFH